MNTSKSSSLLQRVVTSAVLLALFVGAMFELPLWGWMLVMMVLGMLGAEELGRLLAAPGFERFAGVPRAPHYRWLIGVEMLVGVLVILWVLLYELGPIEQMRLVCACYLIALVMSVLILPHWIFRYEWGLLQVSSFMRGCFGLVGVWLLIASWVAAIQLRNVSPWALVLVMGLIWLADIAAYFAGHRFGKNKLSPKTSPGKTREGAIGALVVVTVYAAIVGPFLMPHLSVLQTLPTMAQWLVWIALAWLLFILSVLGDLFESLVKRLADQKDSGTILPGHGGVLDRIDSLLTTLPAAALIMSFLI